MIIFLDVDGVIAIHGKIQPRLVQNLTRIVGHCLAPCRIVLNTAWNAYSLREMQGFLKDAGFPYAGRVVGQTKGCSGGWDLAHQWLVENEALGDPYLILEDATRNWGARWCRLAHCRSDQGITPEVVAKAVDIITRPITERGEVQAAISSLLQECMRLSQIDWITEEERAQHLRETKLLMCEILQDKDFLRSACLIV